MRRILLVILSFLLLNICYSEELTNAINKIIYSHIGIQDKPVWATQISYSDLGSYKVPGTDSTNKVFYYGLRWRDSIMGPVFSYFSDEIVFFKTSIQVSEKAASFFKRSFKLSPPLEMTFAAFSIFSSLLYFDCCT